MNARSILVSLSIAALFALAGCVPSLNPLYTEKDIVFDNALIGDWEEAEDKDQRWSFKKSEDGKSYTLTIDEGERKPGIFEAHLLRLGEHRFLDLFPKSDGFEELARDSLYRIHLVPAHTFIKVDQIEPSLQLRFFNPEWLGKVLEKEPDAIQHAKGGIDKNTIVLTASTPELQKFILRHVNTKDAFGDPGRLNKL